MPIIRNHLTNQELISAAWQGAGFDYQSRVPNATQAGLSEQVRAITDHSDTFNRFLHGLVNVFSTQLVRTNMFDNKLAIFKRASSSFGDTIQEINVGMVKAKRRSVEYDYMEKDIFGQHVPDVQANYHSKNRDEYYPITINAQEIKKAMLSEGALSPLLEQILSAPTRSANFDEFNLMIQLLNEYEKVDGFYKIQVANVASLSSDKRDSDDMLRKLRYTAENMEFESTRYNASKMYGRADMDDLAILTTPEAKSGIDVNSYAQFFNISHGEVHNRMITIPKNAVTIPGFQAALVEKSWFVVSDIHTENTSMVNPIGGYTNYFLKTEGIFSCSRFANAAVFTTEAGTEEIEVISLITGINNITLKTPSGETVTSVIRGGVYQSDSSAITSITSVNDAVSWSLTGANSSHTAVDQNGILHIASDETSDEVKVTASTVGVDAQHPMSDPFTKTVTLSISGEVVPLWPVDQVPTGITVQGIAVTPAFNPTTTAYTVTVPLAETGDGFKVEGVSDFKVVKPAGVATVTAYSPIKDRVYTVTVTVTP